MAQSGLAGSKRVHKSPKQKGNKKGVEVIVEGPHPPATGDGDLTQPLVYSPSETLAPFAWVAVGPATVPLALVAARARMSASASIAAYEPSMNTGRECDE